MNKILEAILRGILMGLEIQDDGLDLPTFLKSEVTSDRHVDRANKIRWIRDNFVDLGLPSGTLWCKWNLGATNGDTPKSWYGNYYAWGEVKSKKNFVWETYKHYAKSSDSITKYNGDDDKIALDIEDDAVSVTLGKDFRMPTKADFEELCALPSEWVEDYNEVEGLDGRVFIGNNGNKLFIPAAGYLFKSIPGCVSSSCNMWSSSIYVSDRRFANDMYFNSSIVVPQDNSHRYDGMSVRAVI